MRVTGFKSFKTGTYQIEVMRWPAESERELMKNWLPELMYLARVRHFVQIGQAIGAKSATLRLNGENRRLNL